MTSYSGSLAVSGTLNASNGASEAYSGTLGVTLSAALDGSGNGTASETVTGNINYVYILPNGSQVPGGTIPFNFSDPSLLLQSGNFTDSEQSSGSNSQQGITLSGTISTDQHLITEAIALTINGSTNGVSYSGTIYASGTLLGPYLPTITGVSANQATIDTSSISPFRNVSVADLNTGATVTVTVTLSASSNGTLSNLSVGSYDATRGIYTVSGTALQVSAAVAGLTFNPTQGQVDNGQTVTTGFTIDLTDTAGESVSNSITTVIAARGATFKTLASFNGSDGIFPWGNLVSDAEGNLFGTTQRGGINGPGYGVLYEIVKTASGYVNTPTVLLNATQQQDFDYLTIDAAGNLFGSGTYSTPSIPGIVYELHGTGGNYASTLTTLASFDYSTNREVAPGVIADSAGDLFGMTEYGGTNSPTSVFEIVKNGDNYAPPITLASFGREFIPNGLLFMDPEGNLFGATYDGGTNGDGTVFEVAKTAGGYASTPITLVNFTGQPNGVEPIGPLVADAAGDLFGMAQHGGTNNDGTVFEIVKTAAGYASTPTVLYNFNDDRYGGSPDDGLLIDAAGNLFGTTVIGGSHGDGTVFEITKTAGGYASTPNVLYMFDDNAPRPNGGLLVDSAGNFYGTTSGLSINGMTADGSVFELSNTGYRVSSHVAGDFVGNGHSDLLFQNSNGQAAAWLMNGAAMTGGGLIGANPGPSWQIKGTGDFNGDGTSDILWQNTDGTVADWLITGTSVIGGGVVGSNPGPSWQIKGTGDFNGDGNRDILWQNIDGTVAIWELNGTSVIGGGLVGSNPGPSWQIKGTGDFNGDGNSDILFQNTDGTVAIWLMSGTSVIGGSIVGSNPGPSWHVIGAGDFDGDGKSDILLQNDSGQAAIWLMNGTTNTGGGLVGVNPGPSWQAKGTGDYNGDGMSDIVWQNTNGTPAIWLMNGTSVIGGGIPGSSNPGTSWHLIAGTG